MLLHYAQATASSTSLSLCTTTRTTMSCRTATVLFMVLKKRDPNSSNNYYPDLDDAAVASEETLLCAHLTRIPSADLNESQTHDLLLQYTRSFPFAAVLPVQPLVYLPTPRGVEIQFLRKKTATKPTVDGGIRIFLCNDGDSSSSSSSSSPTSLTTATTTTTTDSSSSTTATTTTPITSSWTITAKRNSQGQSISKIFAEKLVIQEFLRGLMGSSQEFLGPAGMNKIQPRDIVRVTSVYHKWMSENKM